MYLLLYVHVCVSLSVCLPVCLSVSLSLSLTTPPPPNPPRLSPLSHCPTYVAHSHTRALFLSPESLSPSPPPLLYPLFPASSPQHRSGHTILITFPPCQLLRWRGRQCTQSNRQVSDLSGLEFLYRDSPPPCAPSLCHSHRLQQPAAVVSD